MDKRNWFQKLFRFCPYCGRWFCHDIKRRRQNTQYHEEESNYVTCCAECFGQIEEIWAEMWEWYYSTRL